MKKPLPFLGFGLGLRSRHYGYIEKNRPNIDWFEVISENYMAGGGLPLYHLDKIREQYPMVLHGVSLNLGSTDPLNRAYLNDLKKLSQRVNPPWISDHLCWTGTHGHNSHDLLPLPYTPEVASLVAERIRTVQDFLEKPFLVENVSSYMEYKRSSLTEWEFLSQILVEADCYLLLDVNNIYVSSVNHGFDPLDYLNAIPQDRVAQIHLAGHSNKKKFLLDTHDHPVCQGVFDLYQAALRRFGRISTMIERDDRIPPFPVLEKELNKAKILFNEVHEKPRKDKTAA